MGTQYYYKDGQVLHYENGDLVDARAPSPSEEALGKEIERLRISLNEIACHGTTGPMGMPEVDAYRLAAYSMIRIASDALRMRTK